jgi:hypothetical protein
MERSEGQVASFDAEVETSSHGPPLNQAFVPLDAIVEFENGILTPHTHSSSERHFDLDLMKPRCVGSITMGIQKSILEVDVT